MALGVFFVLLAVLVSVVRLGGPLLNQHRAAVIGTLLGESQLEVSVDHVGLEWTPRGPAIGLGCRAGANRNSSGAGSGCEKK